VATIQSTAEPITVEITGDVSKRNFTTKRSTHERRLDKRSVVTCADAAQADFIQASYTESQALAAAGSSYAAGGGALTSAYFSSNDVSAVTGVLDAVASEADSSRTLSCTDDYGICDGNVIAYTFLRTTNVCCIFTSDFIPYLIAVLLQIYYCDIFFQEVETSQLCGGVTVDDRAIRGGTTLHELTHAVAGTDDVTYGCPADQALSAGEQIANADNFNVRCPSILFP